MKAPLVLLILFAIYGCNTDHQFAIHGSIPDDYNDHWIYLNEFMESEPMVDSFLVKNGHFKFSGTVDYPEVFVLHNKAKDEFQYFPFFLEAEKLNISINLDDWTWGSEIYGGPINQEYHKEIGIHEQEVVNQNRLIDKKMAVADSTEQIVLQKEQTDLNEKYQQICMEYVKNQPSSPISPYLLSQRFFGDPFGDYEDILNSLSEENRQTSICLSMQERIDLMKEYKDAHLDTD